MILGILESERSEPRSRPTRKLPRELAEVLERSPVYFLDHPPITASSDQQSPATDDAPLSSRANLFLALTAEVEPRSVLLGRYAPAALGPEVGFSRVPSHVAMASTCYPG